MMPESNISTEYAPPGVFLKNLQHPSYKDFLENINPADIDIVCYTVPVTIMDPLMCLEKLADEEQFQFFWENPDLNFSMAAGGTLVELDGAKTGDRFMKMSQEIRAISSRTAEFTASHHQHTGLHFLGGFSFFNDDHESRWKSFGSASFTIPQWLIVKEDSRTPSELLTVAVAVEGHDSAESLDVKIKSRLRFIAKIFSTDFNVPHVSRNKPDHPETNSFIFHQPEHSYEEWTSSVRKANRLIEEHRFDKIVLAREYIIETSQALAPTQIVHSLRKEYPNCYSFLIHKKGGGTFIGSTPERLASFRENRVLTEALAGSIPRGTTETEDAELENQLLLSSKNSKEHQFVVKAIEQKLQPFITKIDRNSKPDIKKLPNVQHLHTPIIAWLKKDTDPLSLIRALHPTPAVGGYPWKKASKYIKELENFSRGWYAGPVGWLKSNGDGEFSVAIRSGLIEKQEARFYAGCGIVAGSDPETEWQESNLKLMPLLSALRYD